MDRLKKRADFLAAAQGPRAARPAFIVQSRVRADADAARVGFTVSKKVGNAPERNRVRRRLREVVKQAGVVPSPRDYVIVGRRSALERDFAAMIDDFRSALAQLARAGADRSDNQSSRSSNTRPNGTKSDPKRRTPET